MTIDVPVDGGPGNRDQVLQALRSIVDEGETMILTARRVDLEAEIGANRVGFWLSVLSGRRDDRDVPDTEFEVDAAWKSTSCVKWSVERAASSEPDVDGETDRGQDSRLVTDGAGRRPLSNATWATTPSGGTVAYECDDGYDRRLIVADGVGYSADADIGFVSVVPEDCPPEVAEALLQDIEDQLEPIVEGDL